MCKWSRAGSKGKQKERRPAAATAAGKTISADAIRETTRGRRRHRTRVHPQPGAGGERGGGAEEDEGGSSSGSDEVSLELDSRAWTLCAMID